MTITLINYSNYNYDISRAQLRETALSMGGINNVIEYNDKDIPDDFRQECSNHFSHIRGAGYWVWKPYLILKALDTINDGDYLVYCDVAAWFRSSIQPYIDKMSDSIMLFLPDTDWKEYQYTKMDIFKLLNVEDNKSITHSRQIESGFILLKKSKTSYDFIKMWLELSKNYHLISDEPSIEPNYSDFIENRHDQSLLSVLGKKYKDASNIDFEYKPFIFHHKLRR